MDAAPSGLFPTLRDRRRDEFPSLATGIHLLSHSLGPVPRAAHQALSKYLAEWEGQILEDAWERHWWDLPRAVGDRIAPLLGAPAGSVQVQPSTSVALAAVASCFDFQGPRHKVITSGLDFPTTGYVWAAHRRLGADVHVVPADDDLTIPVERIVAAIDDRTALVALSHVAYLSGHRLEVEPVVAAARRAGARVLLDVYQSAGVLELDAAGWGVDFMIGGTIKWLCGGPACGYLYVRPDLLPSLQPRLTGWFAHARPFDFEAGPIRYDAGVRRFAQGTPPIPALYACLPGLDLISEVGVARIAAESRRRTQAIVTHARERGWPLRCPAEVDRRGGAVMIAVPQPAEVVARLRRARVLVDWRPRVGLRLSPHFFNTDEEISEALDHLEGLVTPKD